MTDSILIYGIHVGPTGATTSVGQTEGKRTGMNCMVDCKQGKGAGRAAGAVYRGLVARLFWLDWSSLARAHPSPRPPPRWHNSILALSCKRLSRTELTPIKTPLENPPLLWEILSH